MEYFVYPPFIENLPSREFRAVFQVLAWQKLGVDAKDALAEQKENPVLRVVRAEGGESHAKQGKLLSYKQANAS